MKTRLVIAAVCAAFFPSVRVQAQCGQWDPRIGQPGFGNINPTIWCSAVFNDGTGPKLYVGGNFLTAGGVTVNNVARWNGTSWSALGTGTDLQVLAMCVYNDGSGDKLYIAGDFANAGGNAAKHLARWDGVNWSEVGGGVSVTGSVRALTVASIAGPSRLYVGGTFNSVGAIPMVNNIASWDSAGWHTLGTGAAGNVYSIAAWDGPGAGPLELFVSGQFFSAGGNPASRIAKWDGTMWTALGLGLSNEARSMTPFNDGSGEKLFCGGTFNHAGGPNVWYIATWDAANWVQVGGQSNGSFLSLLVHDDGGGARLYGGGAFSLLGAQAANRIARWDGVSWQPLRGGISAGGNADVRTLTTYSDAYGTALFVGGTGILSVDGLTANYGATWRGESIGINYCTSKTTTSGCLPIMSCTGAPDITAAGSFTITASNMQPNVNGLVFYGFSGISGGAFQGGFLCVKAPTFRLVVKSTGGAAACSGSISYTLADILAHPGPNVPAGTRVDCQAWFRDPPSPSTTGLSNGLDFFVCP